MANIAVDASEVPQVFPGTMLKVEEGQDCAVLCATDDESGSASAAAAGRPTASPRAAVHGAKTPRPAGAAAAVAGAAAAGGPSRQGKSDGGSGGGDEEGEEEGEDGYEYYDGDEYFDDLGEEGATARARTGDGSSLGDETETFSELSDPGGTEVVFVREGVAVWPCGARSERILGRLSLVKQCNVLFMAWLPYSRGVLQQDGTFRVTAAQAAAAAAPPPPEAATGRGSGWAAGRRAGGGRSGGGEKGRADWAAPPALPSGTDRTLYAVHPIPLSEVKALRRRPPPLGLGLGLGWAGYGRSCPSLLVVLTSGVTLPPLHFTRGGVKALIATLKQHVFLLKSADEPHTYLVNDTADPLSRSLSALQLADVLIGGPPPGASATFEPGEGVVAAAAAAAAPPPPPAAWATPTTGLGLAAAAGLSNGGGGGGRVADAGGGLGVGLGLGLGLGLGSAVSWCWADQPPAAAAAARATASTGLGGFEAVEEGEDGEDGGEDGGGGGGGAARRQPNAWAYGIVDAINRFVQNVRGTASGWIGALDDLDEQDDDDLYGKEMYDRPLYDDTEPAAASAGDAAAAAAERRRDEDCGAAAAAAATGAGAPPPCASRAGPAPNSGGSSSGSQAGRAGAPPPAAAAPAAAAAAAAAASSCSSEVGDFELLDGGGCWGEAAAHPAPRRRLRPPPLSAEEWAAMFDAEGRLVGEAALRDRVFASGCVSELRREVWKHLLGMYPRGSTAAQRSETAAKWQAEYKTLRQQWQSMMPAQEARCGSWRCHRTAVDKDVRRTDRGHPFFAREGCAGLRALRNVLLTHVVYDRDLGYCQGMSDLAAPLLVVMRDEAEAFWAFAALMERMGSNFQGMNLQLGALRRLMQLLDPQLHAFFERRDCLSYYFAFRWLLILFKREFKFEEVLTLWEACWSCRRTRHLHLYLAAAVLVHHRRVILSSDLDFDGMLRLSIGLAGRLELQPLLETAEALAGYAGEAGSEVTAWLP
ncbi:hypothetical protein PLESTB_001542900 [Pleodorina starrii]|uniref:Rab-GAP TBC domain-containing protein n=1 Tax=Pleodorina starrii TaxID=330485 RepID=A0A9W6BXE3_9CHLO|nr:hypothetical protein PLESTB_001542900 [Pleodorina starrii]GLC69109.1 hypothetical protein PLESTF_000790100 [Pleodorina starrii]